MSSPNPSAAPTAKSPPVSAGATLAPPSQISRPGSANSSRSSSSRRRGGNKSGSVSPAGSDTNRSGNKVVTNGTTTTVSGGVKLGGHISKQTSRNATSPGNNVNKKDAKENVSGQGKGKAKKGGSNSQQRNGNGENPSSRPQPIDTGGPPRPKSSNSAKSESQAQPRSLHAHVSPPRTAMDAAFEAAHQKHHDIGGGDALTSLQKMISDLKAISPSATTSSSSLPSAPSTGRSMSLSQGDKLNISSQAPVTIPVSASGKKLKADAPSFTPTLSPGVSNASLSPSNVLPLPAVQARSASFAAGTNRRSGSMSSNHANIATNASGPSASFSAGMSHMPLSSIGFQNSLSGLPESVNETANPFGIDFAYQQQLLAAQYQQIQLLQAQIQANQVAQQQTQQQQQQQQTTSFIAPRFQALAAQRIQQQQEQQAQLYQAHAQAQQVYQIQQQQIADQQSLANKQPESAKAPPVFEEDSPEQKPVPLGTSGRPQLNPNFTFGAKRQESGRESMSPPMGQAPIINRSEGIGGAAATGLAGLAARAHKRTGSEITPQMQEQVSRFT